VKTTGALGKGIDFQTGAGCKPPAIFDDDSFSVRRVRGDILCPLRRNQSVRKRDHSAWSKITVFLFAAISLRGILMMFFMQNSMDGSICNSRLCVGRKKEGVSKYWRYDTTERLSHASMPVFGGLANTLTRID
jgi:hypothetical protein